MARPAYVGELHLRSEFLDASTISDSDLNKNRLIKG